MKLNYTRRSLLVSVLSIIMFCNAFAKSDELFIKKSLFKITSKIFIDGKLVSSPQIVAYANQKASIMLSKKNGEQNLKLALIAKDFAKDRIKIDYDFY